MQQYRVNNQISAPELRLIGETGENIGVVSRQEALRLAAEKSLDLIEIAPTAKPPVARIISFDKFRYQKEKEEKKQRVAQKVKEMKQIRITARAAANDLQIRVTQAEKFLADGHKIEINLFLRGREKANKDWALKKMKEFLALIQIPHTVTLPPKQGGRGFVAQITKK
ncbi:MAG: translation initiation factor IF-3 [Patescibacteria group bacterium]